MQKPCQALPSARFRASRPASVIKPRRSKSAHRCLFNSVQWLRFCRAKAAGPCARPASPCRWSLFHDINVRNGARPGILATVARHPALLLAGMMLLQPLPQLRPFREIQQTDNLHCYWFFFASTLSPNFFSSMMKRSCVPWPTRPASSYTATLKVILRRSTSITSDSLQTFIPTGVALS